VGRHRRALGALACLIPLLLGAALASWRNPSAPNLDQHLAYTAGVQAYNEGRYEDAAKDFGNAVLADPNDTRSCLYHAFALLQQSRGLSGPAESHLLDIASINFDRVRSDDSTPLVRACLAYCLTRSTKDLAALYWTEEDAKAPGATTVLLNNHACTCIQLSRLDAAERTLARIPGEDQSLPEVCYNRALLARKRRHQSLTSSPPPVLPAQALTDIERVLEHWPDRWEPQQEAAHLYAYAAEDEGRRLATLLGLPVPLCGAPAPLAGALFALRESRKQEAIKHFSSALEHARQLPDPTKDKDLNQAREQFFCVLNGRLDCKQSQGFWVPPRAPRSLTLRLLNPAPDRLK
jgi:tetratricopeptide (TPR) repeat protein